MPDSRDPRVVPMHAMAVFDHGTTSISQGLFSDEREFAEENAALGMVRQGAARVSKVLLPSPEHCL